jgi:hypothetical protein
VEVFRTRLDCSHTTHCSSCICTCYVSQYKCMYKYVCIVCFVCVCVLCDILSYVDIKKKVSMR